MESKPELEQPSGEPVHSSNKANERVQLRLILISFIILAIAAVWTYRIGMQANAADHELSHLTEDNEGLSKNVELLEKEAKTLPGGAVK
jgi:hypothetical protein